MGVTRPRYAVREWKDTFFVVDTTTKGRVTVHAHRTREPAQVEADRLNTGEDLYRAGLEDPVWPARHRD